MVTATATRRPSPLTRNPDGTVSWVHRAGDQYLVTGTDRQGRRFRVQYCTWAMARAINIYRGRRWLVRDGRRYLIEEVWN